MLLKTACFIAIGLSVSTSAAIAQTRYPVCQPPRNGEYLVLVVNETPESQVQALRTLPANSAATICSYQETVVTRVGGFSSQDSASSLARYMTESGGFPAYVVRPATTAAAPSPPPVVSPQPQPSPAPTQSTTPRNPPPATSSRTRLAYNPQVMGSGYAVLVNYFNKPELAEQVRRVTGRDVGLVAYRRQPYLLANYTPNRGTADATVKALKNKGLTVVLVDSRQVVLLRQAVQR